VNEDQISWSLMKILFIDMIKIIFFNCMLLFYYLYVISKRSQSGHGLWNRIETTDHIEESEARYWSVFVYPIQEVPV